MNCLTSCQTTLDLGSWEVRKFQGSPWKLGIAGNILAGLLKITFWQLLCKIAKKTAVKHFIEKPILRNFVYCLQYFVQGCPRKHVFISNSAQTKWNLCTFFIYFGIWKNLFTLETRKKVAKKTLIWYISRSAILHFSVKYKFGTKNRSNWNSAVFMYSFFY